MKNENIFRPKNYPGPIALDAIPSKECQEYHRNSSIQINMPNECFIRRPNDGHSPSSQSTESRTTKES